MANNSRRSGKKKTKKRQNNNVKKYEPKYEPKRASRAKKNSSFGGVIAVFFGVVIGVSILIGVGIYAAIDTPSQQSQDVVQTIANIDIPMPEPVFIMAMETETTAETEWESTLEPELESDIEYEPTLEPLPSPDPQAEAEAESEIVTITISAAGDITLGGDRRWRGYHQFMRYFERYGHEFFLRNVHDIFYESCLAIVNLEGTLTYANQHIDKEFVFRGPPHFSQILSYGAVDVVTIANNHTIDFFDQGYRDTINALRGEGIIYFGNEFNTIIEVNGIKVGLFGFRIWNPYHHNRTRIENAIADLRERGAQLVIAYHHWGDENVNQANNVQRTMGRFTIESGADLVLGSHPHVIQGIEVYQGRNIVYSLANFSFGGNSNPTDQDTFIFQQTFSFYNGELMDTNETYIIPVMISSTRSHNNFQPTVAEGGDAERILERLRRYSSFD